MGRTSIAHRLRLAFLVMSVLTLAVGALCISRMHELNQATAKIAGHHLAKVRLAQTGVRKVHENGRSALHLFLIRDPRTFDEELAEQGATSREISEIYAQFEHLLDADDERALFGAITAARARYRSTRAEAEEVLRTGDRQRALTKFEHEVLPALDEYIDDWDVLLELEGRRANEAAVNAATSYARARAVTLALTGIALVLGMGVAFFVTRLITRPILAISDAATRLQSGDLAARADVSSNDELGTLAAAFNSMSEAVAFRHERLAREMNLAQHIQTALLPRTFCVAGLDVTAAMNPATEVGGDYYDVLPVHDGCWIGIGDVAGHGLNAGLIMLMIQSSVAALVREDPDRTPRALVTTVNKVIFENLHERLVLDEHATMTLLRFHDDGFVAFAGAHEEVLVCRAETGRCEAIDTPGTWIGAIDDIAAMTSDSSLRLAQDDVMILFTDGVTEARNAEGVPFGIERLFGAIEGARGLAVETIRDRVLDAIAAWAPQPDDDVSLVVARYTGPVV